MLFHDYSEPDAAMPCVRGTRPGKRGADLEAPELSVVMPVYNEEEALPDVLDEALAALCTAPFSFDITLADDASTDRSLEILKEYQLRHPDIIRIISHRSNRGIIGTCETLFNAARGAYVFCNASDGQWKTAEGLRFMELRDRFDIIVGVRREKQYTPWRKVISEAFNLLPWLMFGVRTYDAGSIKLYHSEVLRIPLTSRGPFREAERIIRATRRGYRVGTIEVEHFNRRGGRATGARWSLILLSLSDLLRCWWQIVFCRSL
jgi:undecaprenyl-phosphate 4-deoxy-4-formamido-L-arabinose transferase